jgi:hypothetical protein
MEGIMDDLTLKVQKMANHYDRMVFYAVTHQPGVFTSPLAASSHATNSSSHELPNGRRVQQVTRDLGSDVVTTWTHIPASDMCPSPSHVSIPTIPTARPPAHNPNQPPLPPLVPIHQPSPHTNPITQPSPVPNQI